MNEKLKRFIVKNYHGAARALVNNPEALNFKFSEIKGKLNKKGIAESFGQYFDDLKTLFRMVKAWSEGDYLQVSKSTIIYVVLCLIYFVTPTDFIPDFLIGLGFLDDIAVLKWTIKKIKNDIDNFIIWENKNV